MGSLRDFRKKAGLLQRPFGQAVFKMAKQSIAPAYAQKMVSLWESGTIVPSDDLQLIICSILKIDPSEISFTQSQRTPKDFIDLLVNSGLEKEDAKLLTDNKGLQEIALNVMVKNVHLVCDRFRSFGSNFDSAS